MPSMANRGNVSAQRGRAGASGPSGGGGTGGGRSPGNTGGGRTPSGTPSGGGGLGRAADVLQLTLTPEQEEFQKRLRAAGLLLDSQGVLL